MNNTLNMKSRMSPYLSIAVFALCFMQPMLDVLSYFLDNAGLSNTPTLILRLAVLCFTVALAWIFTERRKAYIAMFLVLLLHVLLHSVACMQKGYADPFGDWTNLLRIYQLPLTAVCFLTFLRADDSVYPTLRRALFCCLALIALVELLSFITDTNPYTYEDKKIGLLGWFYWANSQSAILSVLVPVVLVWLIHRFSYKPLPSLVFTAAAFSLLYFFATRLAYLALIATGLGLALTLIITDRSRRGCIAVLLTCTVVFAALLPVSPMYRNQQLVEKNAVLKQEHIDSLIAADEKQALDDGLSGEDLRLARLDGAYNEYLGGLVGRFGLERVAALYSYSEDASELADARLMKINYCKLCLEDSPLLSALFGLELSEMTYNGIIHDVENDFHGIYYLCGGAGLLLLAAFLLFFLCRIAIAVFKNPKRYFTFETASWGIALIMCLAHAYSTAGVLRRPNASFYFAVVLAVTAFLTDDIFRRGSADRHI